MDALVLRVALVVLAIAVPAWIVLSCVIIVGRLRYERTRRAPDSVPLGKGQADRLVRRAAGNPRTEWGRWRRVTALQRLEQAHHPAVPRLIRRVLGDRLRGAG